MARRKGLTEQHRAALRRVYRKERRSSALPKEERTRRLRLGELRRLCRHRYGGDELPDDDAGRSDLREIFAVIGLGTGNVIADMNEEAKILVPWMEPKEVERIARSVEAQPRDCLKSKADTIGKRLNLSYADRQRLGICTIGAYDVDKEARTELRIQRECERKRQARRAKGATPRTEYESQSLNRNKPWIGAGMSRATWYRLKANSKNAR